MLVYRKGLSSGISRQHLRRTSCRREQDTAHFQFPEGIDDRSNRGSLPRAGISVDHQYVRIIPADKGGDILQKPVLAGRRRETQMREESSVQKTGLSHHTFLLNII